MSGKTNMVLCCVALCAAVVASGCFGFYYAVPLYDKTVSGAQYWWHVSTTPPQTMSASAKTAAYLPPVFDGKSIVGRSADLKHTVTLPIDLNDSIGSVYACFDLLQSKFGNSCGTCYVPQGSLNEGRTMGLSRRIGKDAHCLVDVQRERHG